MAAHEKDLSQLKAHLLELGRHSILPQRNAPPALPGTDDEVAVLERFRPFAELFLLVASADGSVDPRERAVTLGAFRALSGGRVRGASLEGLEQQVEQQLKSVDRLDMLESVCSALAGDREDAELAFTLGSVVALADESLDRQEQDLLVQLATWLRIPPDRAEALLQSVRERPASES